MKVLIRIALLLVILLVSLSAYLRLAHSGIGCYDWPNCYGQIGQPPVVSQPISSENAYQRIVAEASQPLAWATPLHRLVASVLGLLIVFLVMLAFKQKKDRLIALATLAVTVFLALLGVKSGGLHNPAVVMGNLSGGFVMLGLLGWMLFKDAGFNDPDLNVVERQQVPMSSKLLRILPAAAIILLVIQILLGGLTSANFAATSCQSLPDCHGSWLPGADVFKAMDLSRTQQVTASGQAIGGQERIDIHIAHRVGAVITATMVLLAGFFAWRAGGRMRFAGTIVLLLVTIEFSIGVAAIASDLPIGLAVAHNLLAGLLLLGLLKVVALNR